MSRIGKNPVIIPDNVTVDINNNSVLVKGPKEELKQKFEDIVIISKVENTIIVKPAKEQDKVGAYWGLTRKIIQNMVDGVTKGFEKKLFIEGVGYKALVKGSNLVLTLGFTKPIEINIPSDLKVTVNDNVNITIRGADKYIVGQFTAHVRDQKKPEPYKGKGIRYLGEYIKIKVGKTGV